MKTEAQIKERIEVFQLFLNLEYLKPDGIVYAENCIAELKEVLEVKQGCNNSL